MFVKTGTIIFFGKIVDNVGSRKTMVTARIAAQYLKNPFQRSYGNYKQKEMQDGRKRARINSVNKGEMASIELIQLGFKIFYLSKLLINETYYNKLQPYSGEKIF